MRIPLAIGAVLVALVFAGWIRQDVEWAIYPLLGAPIAGFAAGVAVGRELQAFYSTAAVSALCLFLWAVAMNDLRRREPPRSSAPAQLEPRGGR